MLNPTALCEVQKLWTALLMLETLAYGTKAAVLDDYSRVRVYILRSNMVSPDALRYPETKHSWATHRIQVHPIQQVEHYLCDSGLKILPPTDSLSTTARGGCLLWNLRRNNVLPVGQGGRLADRPHRSNRHRGSRGLVRHALHWDAVCNWLGLVGCGRI